jgi:hypothetical protein
MMPIPLKRLPELFFDPELWESFVTYFDGTEIALERIGHRPESTGYHREGDAVFAKSDKDPCPRSLKSIMTSVAFPAFAQPGDPAWANDNEVKAYKEFLKKYASSANPDDYSVLVAYMNVHAITLALELTRENLIHQATSLQGERLAMMLPGVHIGTTPNDYTPFRTLRIAIFDGTSWTLSGDPVSAE